MTEAKLGRVGLIGRFKPLHNGAAVMLEAICAQAAEVVIGVGSCNKYNTRNPFTAAETKEMIDALLAPKFNNYRVVFIPDFAQDPKYRDGQRWRQEMRTQYGTLDHFVSGNPYVAELLSPDYDVIPSASLVPPELQTRLRGTEVRVEMARGERWKQLVPQPVVEYLERNGLVDRFRKEFGLQTLATLADDPDYHHAESAGKERVHTFET